MVDSVAILPALSFLEQVDDLSNFLARALPETEKNEFLGSIRQLIESSAKTVTEQGEEGEETKQVIEEPTNEEKEQTISRIVGVITGGHPGLEGNDREIESQYLLLTTLIQSTKNAEQTLKSISDAVVRSASGSKKAEVACRILSNIYNLLSSSSSLRPQTLSSLFQLLTSNSTLELSYFPLTNAWLTSALSQWNISTSEKISWLSDVAEIYETKGSKKGDKEKGLELRTFALRTAAQDGKVEESKDLTKRALRALLAIPNKFDLEEVLSVKTARDGLTGEYKDMVELIESGELEQGLAWVAKNGDFLSGESLKADQIVRKLRLLALTTLAAQSATKEISYAEIANALKLDEDDIEISVIDAIHSGLMKASLSQPTKTLRVQSVQARSFGSAEWQLLDKRLGEWKTVLEDVQKVIQDAIIVNEQSAKDVRGGYKKGPRKPNNAKPEESKTDESADRTQVAASA